MIVANYIGQTKIITKNGTLSCAAMSLLNHKRYYINL